jgi:HAD superfamily hydrolase (TIGR01509 family)
MQFPHKPQGVIFDMDGLLIDTIPVYVEAMTRAGIEVGHHVSRKHLLSLIGLLGQELQERLVHDWGQQFPVEDFLQNTGKHLSTILDKGAPLKKGAAELIEYLSSVAMPLAVATSMKKKDAEHQLELANLRHFFREVVGRDEVERSKPHPDLYLKAASLLGFEPHTCIALEDSFHGIRSAHRAGCMVVMVPDVLAPTEETRSLCTGVASDLYEVRTILQRDHAAQNWSIHAL